MLLNELTNDRIPLKSEHLYQLRYNCSEFIQESNGIPIYKHISSKESFLKVKVRHKVQPFTEFFDPDIQRHAAGGKALLSSSTIPENYWIFPINGYKFVYSECTDDYKQIASEILHHTSDIELVSELFTSIYKTTDLHKGLTEAAEILWYKIPFYFAVDVKLFRNYNELLAVL